MKMCCWAVSKYHPVNDKFQSYALRVLDRSRVSLCRDSEVLAIFTLGRTRACVVVHRCTCMYVYAGSLNFAFHLHATSSLADSWVILNRPRSSSETRHRISRAARVPSQDPMPKVRLDSARTAQTAKAFFKKVLPSCRTLRICLIHTTSHHVCSFIVRPPHLTKCIKIATKG